jgi:hypothetical protein
MQDLMSTSNIKQASSDQDVLKPPADKEDPELKTLIDNHTSNLKAIIEAEVEKANNIVREAIRNNEQIFKF